MCTTCIVRYKRPVKTQDGVYLWRMLWHPPGYRHGSRLAADRRQTAVSGSRAARSGERQTVMGDARCTAESLSARDDPN